MACGIRCKTALTAKRFCKCVCEGKNHGTYYKRTFWSVLPPCTPIRLKGFGQVFHLDKNPMRINKDGKVFAINLKGGLECAFVSDVRFIGEPPPSEEKVTEEAEADEVTEQPSENLPPWKCCADCKHFFTCYYIFGKWYSDKTCHWNPSRFTERGNNKSRRKQT